MINGKSNIPSYYCRAAYDVIVIGAGPAGSTAAALLARSGRRVLLLEKSRFPREKLCGEFITPECLAVFDRLGVRQRILAAGAKLVRHWTLYAPDGRAIEVPIEWIADGHPYAIGLTRARMDLILIECARETGVDVLEGFHVSSELERRDGISTVSGRGSDGDTRRFAAPVIIDASGRNGAFSPRIRQEASSLDGSRLFGCKVHLRNIRGLDGNGELFFFADGYGGLVEVEDDDEGPRTSLCFLTTEATLRQARGDRERLLDLTLRTNREAGRRLASIVTAGEWLGTGPITYGRQRSMDGVLAIGDAGVFIDPFTGSGILLALTSGEMAASVIGDAFAGGLSDIEAIISRYRRLHARHFGWRLRACASLRKLAFMPSARNALVTLVSRYRTLMRYIALGTRQRFQP
ncbi:MAG: NAD(P)/FAD-dependent oxidoreductase [Acidobacteriota bacterium]|nr:MAG: NAD(P)/FAD-dependent oxidoreductase [Acidobacteriota bacterium]